MEEKKDLNFIYSGLNEYNAQKFLEFPCVDHQCKINLDDDLLELLKKEKSWFCEEYEYHRSVEDIRRFISDFGKYDNSLPNSLTNEITTKINNDGINPGKTEIKYFSLLFKSFLKIFTKSKSFFREIFDSEFLSFLIFIFQNAGNYKTIFEEYENNFKNFLVFLFEIDSEEIYFSIENTNILPRAIRICFCELAKKKIDEKLTDIGENLDFIRSDFLNLFFYVWKFNSEDQTWFSKTLNKIFENRELIDPKIFLRILEEIKDKLNSKEIKNAINFNSNYVSLKKEMTKKLPFRWFKLPIDKNSYKFNVLCAHLLKKEKAFLNNEANLMNIFNFVIAGNVLNLLTYKFGIEDEKELEQDPFLALFRQEKYHKDVYWISLAKIDLTITDLYLPIFINRKEFIFNYFESLLAELSYISSALKISKNDLQKINFLLTKIKKIILKKDSFHSLELTYDLANYSISLIEYLLLITYGFNPLSKPNKLEKINLGDKNKIKISFLIRPKESKDTKSSINKNLFLSTETLDFIYFNLYSEMTEGGLDFRNRFVHDDWDFSDLAYLPIRLMFLMFSMIEEILAKLIKWQIKTK